MYESDTTVGIFSSFELAKEAQNHLVENYKKISFGNVNWKFVENDGFPVWESGAMSVEIEKCEVLDSLKDWMIFE